jgi:dihydroorotate dehydrogenase electron transfer subunit
MYVGATISTIMNITSISPTPLVDEYPVTVLQNTAYGSGLHHMVLQFSAGFGYGQRHCPIPGQFFMLDVQDTMQGFRFRRPFSLYRWDDATQTGEIIYKVVGQGTALMANWKAGQTSVALSSLGVGVPEVLSQSPENVLLLGGGVGVAPLALWMQSLQHQGTPPPRLVFGVRHYTEAEPLHTHLASLCLPEGFHLCTDDGSAGWHGNPTQWLKHHHNQLGHIQYVFICGPNRMMQGCVTALQQLLPQATVYVSLENHMPCGTGACYGCVVSPALPQQLPIKVCETGPVLRADALTWNATGPETCTFMLDETAFPPLVVEEEAAS